MYTLLYSAAGIAALIGISLLFSYFGILRDTKWKNKMDALRKKVVKMPGSATPEQTGNPTRVIPYDHSAKNSKINNFWRIPKHTTPN